MSPPLDPSAVRQLERLLEDDPLDQLHGLTLTSRAAIARALDADDEFGRACAAVEGALAASPAWAWPGIEAVAPEASGGGRVAARMLVLAWEVRRGAVRRVRDALNRALREGREPEIEIAVDPRCPPHPPIAVTTQVRLADLPALGLPPYVPGCWCTVRVYWGGGS